MGKGVTLFLGGGSPSVSPPPSVSYTVVCHVLILKTVD